MHSLRLQPALGKEGQPETSRCILLCSKRRHSHSQAFHCLWTLNNHKNTGVSVLKGCSRRACAILCFCCLQKWALLTKCLQGVLLKELISIFVENPFTYSPVDWNTKHSLSSLCF